MLQRRRLCDLLVSTFLLLSSESSSAFVSPKIRSPVRYNCQHDTCMRRPTRNNYRYSIGTKLFASLPEDKPSESSVTSTDERNLGILVLMTVPLAWGTFEPAVRFVYTIKPAVPGFVFSVGYYLVAAIALSTLAGLSMTKQKNNPASLEDGTTDNTETQDEDASSSLPILGGIELGTYLFLGNGLQVLGLKTVASDRAAFLLQLTTIFVPLVQAIIAGNLEAVPLKTWGACFIALTGVAVMGLDGVDGDDSSLATLASSFGSLSQGDVFIILAALAYTFHCIRLGRYAKETSAIKLAACKATTETTWSLALVLGLVAFASSNTIADPAGISAYASEQGTEIVNYLSNISNEISSNSLTMSILLPAIAAVFWTGLVTCGYTIYAQSFGQSRVNPTDANLIYTIQPVFTALFAWGLLGETLGPAGYIGGALIGSAVYIVATSDDDSGGETNDNDDDGSSQQSDDREPLEVVEAEKVVTK